jgi:hypothetical protein
MALPDLMKSLRFFFKSRHRLILGLHWRESCGTKSNCSKQLTPQQSSGNADICLPCTASPPVLKFQFENAWKPSRLVVNVRVATRTGEKMNSSADFKQELLLKDLRNSTLALRGRMHA